MTDFNCSAVEADARRAIVAIQLLVVELGANQCLGRVSCGNFGYQIFYERTRDTRVAVRKMVDVGVVLVIDGHRREAQCAALLGLTNAQQLGAGVRPVNTGVSGHTQYTGIINAQRGLQVVKIVVAIKVILQLGFGHV